MYSQLWPSRHQYPASLAGGATSLQHPQPAEPLVSQIISLFRSLYSFTPTTSCLLTSFPLFNDAHNHRCTKFKSMTRREKNNSLRSKKYSTRWWNWGSRQFARKYCGRDVVIVKIIISSNKFINQRNKFMQKIEVVDTVVH